MEDYINQILDTYDMQISPMLTILRRAENNYDYDVLEETISKIDKKIEELNTILQKTDNHSISYNMLANKLMPIQKKYNLSSLKTFFASNHYFDKVLNIIEKMKKIEDISYEEELYLSYYLDANASIQNDNLLFDYSMIQARIGKSKLSFSVFMKLFQTQIQNILPHKKLRIRSLNGDLGRCYYNDFVDIDENHLYDLYEGKNPTPVITIYHEMRHTFQQEMTKNPKSIFAIEMLKEEILIKSIDDYYDENYNQLLTENDANYYGLDRFLSYYQQIGCPLSKETVEIVEKEKQRLIKQMQNKKRTLHGIESSMDAIFEKEIKDKPRLLTIYPSLSIQYKLKENTLVRKTFEDLVEDFNQLEKNTTLSLEKKEDKKLLYKEMFLHNYYSEETNEKKKAI